MIKKLILILLFVPYVAFSQNRELCNSTTSEINKNYPTRVDKVTTIKSSGCITDANNKLMISYNMVVDFDGGSMINHNALDSYRPKVLNTLCSDPETLRLLQYFPVQYKYYFDNGKYIGEIKVSINNCRK